MVNEPPPFWVATGPRGFPGPPLTEPIKAPLLVNVMNPQKTIIRTMHQIGAVNEWNKQTDKQSIEQKINQVQGGDLHRARNHSRKGGDHSQKGGDITNEGGDLHQQA